MKIRPNIKRIILNFSIWSLIIGVLFFLAFINIFIFSSWNFVQPLIIGIYLLLLILLFIAVYKTTYYEIDNKSFTYHCLGKETIFDYEKIHYIDAKQGRNTKTIGVYLSPNNVRYLMNDKDGKLYEILVKNCDQLSIKSNNR